MSATNRGGVRQPQDLYSTPPDTVRALARQLNFTKPMRWGEPCLGTGVIPETLAEFGVPRAGWEWAEIDAGRDYLPGGFGHRVDGIITNPPFALAQEFLEISLEEASFVAYLLRVNFLGARKRRDWWQGREPTHLYVLSERPSFVSKCKAPTYACGDLTLYPQGYVGVCPSCQGRVGPATDATEYAWFVWDYPGDVCRSAPGIYVL